MVSRPQHHPAVPGIGSGSLAMSWSKGPEERCTGPEGQLAHRVPPAEQPRVLSLGGHSRPKVPTAVAVPPPTPASTGTPQGARTHLVTWAMGRQSSSQHWRRTVHAGHWATRHCIHPQGARTETCGLAQPAKLRLRGRRLTQDHTPRPVSCPLPSPASLPCWYGGGG